MTHVSINISVILDENEEFSITGEVNAPHVDLHQRVSTTTHAGSITDWASSYAAKHLIDSIVAQARKMVKAAEREKGLEASSSS